MCGGAVPTTVHANHDHASSTRDAAAGGGGGLDAIDPTTTTTSATSTQTKRMSKATTTTIAFGSCHKNKKSSVPSIWESIVREGESQSPIASQSNQPSEQSTSSTLDAFVWTGDAMYPSYYDAKTGKKRYGPASPDEIAQGFAEMKVNTTIGYTRLLQSPHPIPIYGTRDDHDYGGNDMGKHMPDQRARQQVYWDFLGYQPERTIIRTGTTGSPAAHQEGVYHSIEIFPRSIMNSNNQENEDNIRHDEIPMGDDFHQHDNKINVILLDTRTFREDHCIPSVAHRHPLGNVIGCLTRWLTAGLDLWKVASLWGNGGCETASILGEEQWAWLEHELLTSTADLIIIVSSVQIWTTNPAMESWGHFPKEQERLWTLLQRHYAREDTRNIGPVMFWSGDVHHGEVSGKPGFFEVTSSGMTHHCGQPTIYGRLCRPLLENFSEHRFHKDAFFIGLNYGVLRVNWHERVATVEVKNATGGTVLHVEQPLDMGDDFQLPPYNRLPHTWNGHLWPWSMRCLIVLMVLFLSKMWLLRSHSG
jgi:alkaline phosphatase D